MADDLQGRFSDLKYLGAGAFGRVYRGREKSSNETRALKILPCSGSATREMEAYYGVPDHPNIVKYFTHIQLSGDLICLVMEYCSGGNLNDYLVKRKPDVKENARFMMEIASAMAFLHAYNIVHRDLKPDNILITDNGTLKVADFGLAKIVSDSKHGGSLYECYLSSDRGHMFFSAPEVQDGHTTAKTDVFQMGVVFACILERKVVETMRGERMAAIFVTTHHRFPVGVGQALHDDLVEQYKLNDDLAIGLELRTFVEDMLQKDHHKRPTASEVNTFMYNHHKNHSGSGSGLLGTLRVGLTVGTVATVVGAILLILFK